MSIKFLGFRGGGYFGFWGGGVLAYPARGPRCTSACCLRDNLLQAQALTAQKRLPA